MKTTVEGNAQAIIDDFFNRGGDVGKPFLDDVVAHTVADVYSSRISGQTTPYISAFEHIDPARNDKPVLMVANAAMHDVLHEVHRPVLQDIDEAGQEVASLTVFGGTGLRRLTDLIGSRSIVVEMVPFQRAERQLHMLEASSDDAPAWHVRLNATLHDRAHILKQDVIEAAGIDEIQTARIVPAKPENVLPDAILNSLKQVDGGVLRQLDVQAYFEKMTWFYQHKDLVYEAFQPGSQRLLAGYFIQTMNGFINETLRAAYEDVLKEDPEASNTLPPEVADGLLKELRAPILGRIAMYRMSGDNVPTQPTALMASAETIQTAIGMAAQKKLLAFGTKGEYASILLHNEHLLTIAPSKNPAYVWVRFDQLKPLLSPSDRLTVVSELSNYLIADQGISFI